VAAAKQEPEMPAATPPAKDVVATENESAARLDKELPAERPAATGKGGNVVKFKVAPPPSSLLGRAKHEESQAPAPRASRAYGSEDPMGGRGAPNAAAQPPAPAAKKAKAQGIAPPEVDAFGGAGAAKPRVQAPAAPVPPPGRAPSSTRAI